MSFVDPRFLPYFVTGLTVVTLGFWLAWIDVRNTANRVLAVFLIFKGMTNVLGALRASSDDPAFVTAGMAFGPYLIVPLAPLAVYFVSVYPRRRGPFGTVPGATVLFGLAGMAIIWYMVDHTAWATRVPVEAGQWQNAGRGLTFSEYGWVFVFSNLRFFALALAGAVLARDYYRKPLGSAGYSKFLIAAALLLNGIFDGIDALFNFEVAAASAGFPWLPLGWSHIVLPALSLPMSLLGCAYMLLAIRHEKTNRDLQEARRFLLYALPVPVFIALMLNMPAVSEMLGPAAFSILWAVWRLLVPFMIAYALLRYSLFDFDLRLKVGVKRGILVGAFAVVFLLISEAVENVATDGRSTLFGIAAAAILSLALQPLYAFADKVADTLMPDTKPIEDMTTAERGHMYMEQFHMVDLDGTVTRKEQRMLDNLAIALGLTKEEVASLEAGQSIVDDEAFEDAPPPAQEKSLLRNILIGAAIAVGFGGASEAIEGLLPVSSFVAGLGAAVLVTLLLGPLEALASRLTSPAPEGTDEQRREAYRVALAEAWADGILSRRDRAYLDNLRVHLGLGGREARQMAKVVRQSEAKTT